MAASFPHWSNPADSGVPARKRPLPQGLGRTRRDQHEEQCLRMLLELSADWYWETNAGHRLTRSVPAPGYGQAWLPPSDMRLHRDLLDLKRPFRNVPLVAAPSGRPRHLVISGEPLFDRRHAFIGYRGVGNDITGYKEAELALNASESQLAAIIDSAMDAVVTVDAQGRIVVFNEAAGIMFGCGRAQALGAPLERFVPGALPLTSCPQPVEAALRQPPRVYARALQLRGRRQGGDFPLEASISSIQLDGRILYCLVLRDLTERLAAEQTRQALESQLRQSQKMEALGTLAGGIAHDFNNIVAAILGNAELARANLREPELAPVFLGEISKAGLRARDLVQRIMAFSRNQPPVFRCQPLQPLIEEGVQLLRAMLPSGIEVTYEAEPEPLCVSADGSQIGQVLMNLGTNAWQALGSTPGRISIRLRACRGQPVRAEPVEAGPSTEPVLSLSKGSGRSVDFAEACVAVTDTGCGMDTATIQRIFEPFYTTKPKGEGTGLGLPVVHGIVRSHGGRIEVTSRPGQGSTFEVFLPLAPEPERGAPIEEAAAPASDVCGRGQHVLYLDDYPAMVFMMTATLKAHGYRVSGFGEAREALAWLRGHASEVDLVVTDYNMPGCSGLELAGEVGRLRPDLPLILASGLITEELRQGAAQLGVRHLFDKPRGIDAMCALIGQILDTSPESEGQAP